MAKKFDPFADDDLEFQPNEDSTRVLQKPAPKPVEEPTRVQAGPGANPSLARKARPRSLKLDFSELADQGGDIRGAIAIGSDQLESGEFITGMKKKDLDDAMSRAKAAQLALPIVQVQETRIARKVKTPFYILAFCIVVFLGGLVAGGFWFRDYMQRSNAQRIQDLQGAHP